MKKVVKETNTLVVLGAWNVAIFTPEWVKSNILPQGWEVRVLFPMTIGCSLKFETDLFSFCIEGERLVFSVMQEKDESYIYIIQTLRNIIQKLPHTPIRALGTNFVYQEEGCFEVFNQLNDSDKLAQVVSLVGSSITAQSLTRRFKLNDIEDLNIKIENNNQNLSKIDFNFNYNYKSVEGILDLIGDGDDLLLTNMQLANEIINDVYSK